MTNPLYCILIALNLVIFSVIIGLTSTKRYILQLWQSVCLAVVLFLLQVLAFALHIMMLLAQSPDLGYYCLTSVSMIVLHSLTLILSLVGLGLLLAEPQYNQIQRKVHILVCRAGSASGHARRQAVSRQSFGKHSAAECDEGVREQAVLRWQER
jgi:hypothetical protein